MTSCCTCRSTFARHPVSRYCMSIWDNLTEGGIILGRRRQLSLLLHSSGAAERRSASMPASCPEGQLAELGRECLVFRKGRFVADNYRSRQVVICAIVNSDGRRLLQCLGCSVAEDAASSVPQKCSALRRPWPAPRLKNVAQLFLATGTCKRQIQTP